MFENSPLNPRAETAHLLELTCATSKPGTSRNSSGSERMPDRRMSSCVMTNTAAGTSSARCSFFAADVISIYTTKPGGLFKAKKVAAVAEAAGLKCNVNGSVETGVGNAANIHLAASTGVVTYGCVVPVSTPKGKGKGGIAGIYYQDDIIQEPFEYADGDVIVSSKAGLGIELDEEKLKRYRVS